jgi:acyl-CoA reductase-like NAD-dependent aldehyde dehydrogenase
LADVSNGTADDTDRAIDTARRAFDTSWGYTVTAKERSNILLKISTLLMQNQAQLARILTMEMVGWVGNQLFIHELKKHGTATK